MCLTYLVCSSQEQHRSATILFLTTDLIYEVSFPLDTSNGIALKLQSSLHVISKNVNGPLCHKRNEGIVSPTYSSLKLPIFLTTADFLKTMF